MDMSDDDAEFFSRQNNARTGEVIEDTRDMVGQSPYIINAYINYIGQEDGWEGNISYNVQGSRLSVAGIGLIPDIYELPFNSLNFKLSKSFGFENRFKASLAVTNIIDDDRIKVYRSFMAQDQIFERFLPHRTYTLSFGYTIR